MVVGIEQQGLDDAANAPGRIVRKALDLEPGPRPESVAGEIRIVVDLMRQETTVGRPKEDLPGIEARLDDDVLGAQGDTAGGRVDRPRSRVRSPDDVAEALRGRHRGVVLARTTRGATTLSATRTAASDSVTHCNSIPAAVRSQPSALMMPRLRVSKRGSKSIYPLTAPSVSPLTR